MVFRLATVVLASALAIDAWASAPPFVRTTDGIVQGVARNGVDAFKGIPFAAPPVGKLRWRAPRPVKPWKSALLATHYRAACIQKGMYPPNAAPEAVSEDCLYLNIWKPEKAGTASLPVMVWIYGGGLQNGSAAVPLYAGDRLARHGVIVVTMNYRLGVFGFLALPALTARSTHHSSGDYGLLDQVAALKWVHDNISAFGGDPANVTVFGQSSGSVSISALTASPLTKGLFQRVIGENGSLLPRWPRFEGNRQRLMRFGMRIQAEPLSDVTPLRRISHVYRAARFVVAHWIFLVILAVTATLAMAIAVTRLIRHGLSRHRRAEDWERNARTPR